MNTSQDLASVMASLQSSLKLQAALMAGFEQREARMQAAVEQRMQAVQRELAQVHQRIDGMVKDAGSRIASDAQSAMAPVAARYEGEVSAVSVQLRRAGRMVWMWLGAAGAILLMVLLVGWALLGYYHRQLAAAKDELARYDSAIPVVEAYYASDATLCNGRVCINVDPSGPRSGDQRQYRPARPRPQ